MQKHDATFIDTTPQSVGARNNASSVSRSHALAKFLPTKNHAIRRIANCVLLSGKVQHSKMISSRTPKWTRNQLDNHKNASTKLLSLWRHSLHWNYVCNISAKQLPYNVMLTVVWIKNHGIRILNSNKYVPDIGFLSLCIHFLVMAIYSTNNKIYTSHIYLWKRWRFPMPSITKGKTWTGGG